jgi:MFS family permease
MMASTETTAPAARSILGLSRPFVAYLGSSFISQSGDKLYAFALPWVAYELTHSAFVLGTLYATEVIPVLLFGAFIGVYVDRMDRRRVLLGADLLRAVLLAMLPLLALTGLLRLWQLYIVAFALALLALASEVTIIAILPELARSDNTKANAAFQFVTSGAEFAGPALAGVAIALLGGLNTLWLDVLSFGATFLVTWRLLTFQRLPAQTQVGLLFSELKEGLRWLWKASVIKMLSVQAMLGNLGLGMVSAVLLYYLRTSLSLSAELSGLDYAMIGVGGVLGSLVIVPLARRFRRGALYSALLTCGLLGRGAMVVLHWWWIPGLSLALVAGCDVAWIVLSTSVRQERIPRQLMGRVLSFSRLLSNAAMPLGAVIGGFLAQSYDPQLVFLLAALTKGGEALIARFSAIRKLE